MLTIASKLTKPYFSFCPQATAASIMVSFLVLGLAFGSVLSHASVQLL